MVTPDPTTQCGPYAPASEEDTLSSKLAVAFLSVSEIRYGLESGHLLTLQDSVNRSFINENNHNTIGK